MTDEGTDEVTPVEAGYVCGIHIDKHTSILIDSTTIWIKVKYLLSAVLGVFRPCHARCSHLLDKADRGQMR
jgi:hypothetical protein